MGDLKQLVEMITDRVWKAVPGFSDILIDRATLEQQVRPNIVDILEFMRSGRSISDEDRDRLRNLGRSRALQGVPMAAMIQSFRTAERMLIDAFGAFCIRSSLNAAEQHRGIRVLGEILDTVETITSDAYLEVQRQLRQDHASSVAVLVATLVDGSAQDRVEIDAQARLIGANPILPYRCIALTLTGAAEGSQESTTAPAEWYPANPTPRLTRLQRHVVSALIEAQVPPAPIAGIRDQSLILLVPSAKRDSLEVIARALQPSRYRQVVVGGAGDVDETLFDARNSCRQAVAALEVGLRQQVGREVVRYGDVIVEVMLLGNRDASQRLIQGYLQPLAGHPQLDETIRAFIESGQSTHATAERLIVHVNTIAYRLRRIRELTGRDIRSPSDAVNFSLALRARDLLRS